MASGATRPRVSLSAALALRPPPAEPPSRRRLRERPASALSDAPKTDEAAELERTRAELERTRAELTGLKEQVDLGTLAWKVQDALGALTKLTNLDKSQLEAFVGVRENRAEAARQ